MKKHTRVTAIVGSYRKGGIIDSALLGKKLVSSSTQAAVQSTVALCTVVLLRY
jgi:hypothetical protein